MVCSISAPLRMARAAFLCLALFGAWPASAGAGEIPNIKAFLEQCPTADPIYNTLRADVQLRRNGALVGAIPCAAPISQLPISQYTDELIVVQALRTIYYMDRRQTGHLSWTGGPMYDWFVSRIGGIDIRDEPGSYCCETIDGREFFVIGSQNENDRSWAKGWRGIQAHIEVYGHEARHVDGFDHSSCCGIEEGCDDTFNPSNPSSFAVQYLLHKYWLEGTINVGIACLSHSETEAIAEGHRTTAEIFRRRFCANPPPSLTLPAMPGGPCPLADVPGSPGGKGLFLSEGNPNPFTHSTRIDFVVPKAGHVTLGIYDLSGRRVDTLVDEPLAAGAYSRTWRPVGLTPGAYFYRLQLNAEFGIRKLVMLR